MRPIVSVVFATHGDAHLLARAIPPVLAAQTCEIEVLVVNNDSEQNVSAALGRLASESVRIVDMGRNAGFSGAHNRGIAESRGEFVLLANTDLFVAADYVDELVAFFARHPRAACANGKILRYDLVEGRPTQLLDTAGLSIGRNRRGTDRGEGSNDDGAFDAEEQVFAVSGAAFFARRAALEDVAVDGEVLVGSAESGRNCDPARATLRLRERLVNRCRAHTQFARSHGRTSARPSTPLSTRTAKGGYENAEGAAADLTAPPRAQAS
ncbi:MAG: glycosyltransferase [Actinomycetota bacterium]|nr:glycosyltransferase [Actinomycetota bacterium]